MIKKITLLFLIEFYCISSIAQSNYEKQKISLQSVINVDDLLKRRKDISYIHLSDAVEIFREKYPLSKNVIWWMQDSIEIPKRFILKIPRGQVYSKTGFVIVDGMFVDELLWELTKEGIADNLIMINKLTKPQLVHHKVVVMTQAGSWNYYHWMTEILPKLVMLQESGVDYDYLYLPLDRQYMKETVQLLGIDLDIIIEPIDRYKYIQADELIVPSLVCKFGYTPSFVIQFLQERFIPLAQNSVDPEKFAKKVFISRRKAKSRKIINEDEVFALFQEHGFIRYNLEELSILEQVMLFYNAEIIVGEHGAGLTNIIFSQPRTTVVEIFQAREDATYWYLSQEVGLQHICVKTMEFHTKTNLNGGFVSSTVPLGPIKDLIAMLFE